MFGGPRRAALSMLALALVAAIGVWLRLRPPGARNVLLITVCSVRPDHMSLYAYRRDTTPNLAKLAADSIVFDHAATQWPKTTPAFASLMTGKYGHTHGVMRVALAAQHLGEEHTTIAEVLSRAGYDTAAYVSTAALARNTNIQQGFHTFVETFREPRRGGFAASTRLAIDYLESRRQKPNRHQPFFLWVHYNNAHWPYDPPGVSPDMYVDDGYYDASRRVPVSKMKALPLDLPADYPYRDVMLNPDVGGLNPGAVLRGPRASEYDFYVARYDAGIFSADRMIGELLDAARRIGVLDDTIVVVVGDHGESLGEHNYYFEHGRFPYDEVVRVPLLIRPPGGVAMKRIARPVASFAIGPTVLDMLDIPAPADMEAHSLRNVIDDVPAQLPVFTEAGYARDYVLSVRRGTWKLTHVPDRFTRSLMRGTEYELYDLEKDPAELVELHDSRPEMVNDLRSELEAWAAPWREAAYGSGSPQPQVVDQEVIDGLRALGYIH
jgi:arylsulfatase A-like enzyme